MSEEQPGEVKLYFEEIPAVSDDEDGPTVVFEGDAPPADEQVFDFAPDNKKKNNKKKKKKKKANAGEPKDKPFGTIECSGVKSSNKPAARGGCTFTKVGSRLYVIGGANRKQTHFADVNYLDVQPDNKKSSAWKTVKTSGNGPSARSGHSAIAYKSKIYVFGGINMQEQEIFNDSYVLDTASHTWYKLQLGGLPPSERNSHSVVLASVAAGDATCTKMIIFGGSSPNDGPLNDVHALNLDEVDSRIASGAADISEGISWEQPTISGPLPMLREMHSALVSGSTMHVIGGRSVDRICGDLCSLDLGTMEWAEPRQIPDFGRCAHCSALVPMPTTETTGGGEGGGEEQKAAVGGGVETGANIVLICGGFDGATTIYDDLKLLDLDTCTWQTSNPSPPSFGTRFAHAMAGTSPRQDRENQQDQRMYTFGGMSPMSDLSDVVAIKVTCG